MHKQKSLIKASIIAVICMIILAFVAFFYVDNLRSNLIDDMKMNLKEIAEATTASIEVRIQEDLNKLSSIATMLENENTTDKYKMVKSLDKVAQETKYLRLGIADIDGNCYTSDHVTFNVQDREYFQNALKGQSSFSDTIEDKLAGYKLNVYAVPVYHDGKIDKVLFASSKVKDVANDLLVNIFEDKGFTSIGDAKGNIILNSTSQIANQNIDSLSQLQFLDGFTINQLKMNDEGIASFKTSYNEKRYMAYTPLGMNNWYVFSVVPMSVVTARTNAFISLAIMTWLVIALLFSAIIFYMYINRLKSDRKIDKIIFYDNLTEHYNYNKFRMHAQCILDDKKGEHYALLEFDISDFKMFNELYGYRSGDILLKGIMEVCEEDAKNDEYCARIDSDRFILLWKERDEKKIANRYLKLCDKIMIRMKRTFKQSIIKFYAGIYLIEAQDYELTKCHDRCMYAKVRIKKDKDEVYAFFSNEMHEHIVFDKKLENRMEKALMNEEFEVYLQPKINMEMNQVMGAEALVRWISPDFGMIAPNDFIPLFERNGFLEQLDMYMLDHVCQILVDWKKRNMRSIRISFNVSRMYIFKPGFVKRIHSIVLRHDIDPSCIEVEITENVIYDRSYELMNIIEELHLYGFKVSMDDFGSGYSSLNMLKDIPIDIIKLDQVFFQTELGNHERANDIVAGMIQMAKTLNIEVVAEGIEKVEEVKFLKAAGCDEIQGYYYSKPLPIQEFEKFMKIFE